MLMAVRVQWPSAVATEADLVRVLDLSGLSSSPRQSRGLLKAGLVFLDGQQINDLKKKVPIEATFTLEVRFPGGRVRSLEMMVVKRPFATRTPRQSGDFNFDLKRSKG
jgi:hypothetical protein